MNSRVREVEHQLDALVIVDDSEVCATTARVLGNSGYRVVCVGADPEPMAQLATETGGIPVVCDLENSADLARLADAVGCKLSVLINYGGSIAERFGDSKVRPSSWRRALDVNVSKALLPALAATPSSTIVRFSRAGDCTRLDENGTGLTSGRIKNDTVEAIEALCRDSGAHQIRVTEIILGQLGLGYGEVGSSVASSSSTEPSVTDTRQPLTEYDVADAVSWVLPYVSG